MKKIIATITIINLFIAFSAKASTLLLFEGNAVTAHQSIGIEGDPSGADSYPSISDTTQWTNTKFSMAFLLDCCHSLDMGNDIVHYGGFSAQELVLYGADNVLQTHSENYALSNSNDVFYQNVISNEPMNVADVVPIVGANCPECGYYGTTFKDTNTGSQSMFNSDYNSYLSWSYNNTDLMGGLPISGLTNEPVSFTDSLSVSYYGAESITSMSISGISNVTLTTYETDTIPTLPTPIPASIWLFITGIFSLATLVKKKQ